MCSEAAVPGAGETAAEAGDAAGYDPLLFAAVFVLPGLSLSRVRIGT